MAQGDAALARHRAPQISPLPRAFDTAILHANFGKAILHSRIFKRAKGFSIGDARDSDFQPLSLLAIRWLISRFFNLR